MTIATIVSLVFQLIVMVLKNKFETDASERARKDKLHAELTDAIKRHDADAVNNLLNQLRT